MMYSQFHPRLPHQPQYNIVRSAGPWPSYSFTLTTLVNVQMASQCGVILTGPVATPLHEPSVRSGVKAPLGGYWGNVTFNSFISSLSQIILQSFVSA